MNPFLQLLFDAGKGRASYRRMAVFVCVTWLLLEGHVNQVVWCVVASLFVLTEGLQRVVGELRSLLPPPPPEPPNA